MMKIRRVKLFFVDLVRGIYFGYPICCVLRFVFLFNSSRLENSWEFIGITRDGRNYNPCYFHKKPNPHFSAIPLEERLANYKKLEKELQDQGKAELQILDYMLENHEETPS